MNDTNDNLRDELEKAYEEERLVAERRAKLAALREQGIAFPNDFRRNVMAGELHAEYGNKDNATLESTLVRVRIAGRMMSRRIMGKASFCHLQDMSGRMQLYVTRDRVGEARYREFKQWDIGDILGADGVLFRTRTGELSVQVEEIRLLTKSLRPLPDKWHGLSDTETRYRQRYLDLIMNEVTRKTFRVRSELVTFIRQFLTARGFLEVETPMMQAIPGGATARPFKTYHNTLEMEMFLRIAPELYLKRLVVGGFEKVFEINRNFRNEGLSTRHNPEFTMLEFYEAYADYEDLMTLTEEMMRALLQQVLGTTTLTYQGETYDFTKPFARYTVRESILHFNVQLGASDIDTVDGAARVARQLGMDTRPGWGLGKLQTDIFEKTVESCLKEPTFITSFPAEVSPLARRNDHDPFLTDRFEFFVGGREIANGFSELNDAQDQAERFRKQLEQKEAGDEEAMHFDSDFIRALEHGMPPTAGEGVGIDRLVMLLTDSASIRDVILFPHMRPE
ncbi:MAG: lysine--tRNA ligase [Chromatiales bacterium]